MDKNTIWAIVLSTLVIIASYFLLPMVFPSMKPVNKAAETEVVVDEPKEFTTDEVSNAPSIVVSDDAEEDTTVVLSEEKYTVKTDKVEIVLTNKGGDIISYKLNNHLDMDTQTGVQLADNITAANRACALTIGSVDNKIVNDLFVTEKIDDYTYLFKKNVTVNGQKVTIGKKYTFKPGEYLFKLEVLMHVVDGDGLNFDGIAYSLRTSPQIGPKYNPKQNRYENRQFVTYNGNKYKRTVLSNGQFKRNDKDSIWTGIAGKYFVELVIPEKPETISSTYYSSKYELEDYNNAQAFAERRSFSGSDIQDTYYMYFGPRDDKELKRYNVAESNAWGFGGKKLTECMQTSGWLNWLEVILKWFMKILYKVIPNWGLTIIVMTLLLKIVMFPLSKKQSMGTLKMQELQPKLKVIQEKYKNDQQKLQAETQKIYQAAGYNPASGCLPMLFQFLILFAMYNLFNNYFEFRGAMFIPNWIPDLSTGDSVYTLKFDLPFLGNQIRILPVIYVASQLLSGKITQYGNAGAGQNQASMKFMMYGMPLIFFFLFYNAPAGLLLYWLTSNILQMGQQLIINKMMAEKKAELASNTKTQQKLPPKAKRK